jgi:hypothetical protein
MEHLGLGSIGAPLLVLAVATRAHPVPVGALLDASRTALAERRRQATAGEEVSPATSAACPAGRPARLAGWENKRARGVAFNIIAACLTVERK